MNLHHVDFADYCEVLSLSKVLEVSTSPAGLTLHVVEYAGNDVLIISEPFTGSAVIVEGNDANYGGSIHDHARSAIARGTL